MYMYNVGLQCISITYPKPRRACSGTSSLENPVQKAEPFMCLQALRTTSMHISSHLSPDEEPNHLQIFPREQTPVQRIPVKRFQVPPWVDGLHQGLVHTAVDQNGGYVVQPRCMYVYKQVQC